MGIAARWVVGAGSALALTACSLLVDTSGLAGNAAEDGVSATDGGVDPADAPADAHEEGEVPMSAGGGKPVVTALTAGGDHTCVVVEGAAYCWGKNAHGEIGDGSFVARLAPRAVVGLPPGPLTAISAGDEHTCAIVGGDVYCWGAASDGELGPNASQDAPRPVAVAGLPAGAATDVACGYDYTCAVAAGRAYCWGNNGIGQLGNASTKPSNVPVPVVAKSGAMPDVVSVTAGNDHACATSTTGDVYCWGHSDGGTLGNASAGGSSSSAVPVQGLPGAATSAIIAGWHACAIVAGGAWCWGTGTAGELGDGATANSTLPVQPLGLASSVTALLPAGGATDGDATCAIRSGALLCWGNGQHGRLGDGLTAARSSPFAVSALPAGVTRVAGGFDHFCALVGASDLRCWGSGSSGQLGDGTGQDSLRPVTVAGF